MSKLARTKKSKVAPPASSSPLIPPYRQLAYILSAINPSFLKDRLAVYLNAADLLISELKTRSAPDETLLQVLKAYSKQARLVDMILAIGGASGYLPTQDKLTAQMIYLSVEKELLERTCTIKNGILTVRSESGPLAQKIRSNFGNRLGALFARLTHQTAANEAGEATRKEAHPSGISDTRIDDLLKKARAKASRDGTTAISFYEKILEIDPDNCDALCGLGDLAMHQCNYGAAQTFLRKAYRLRPQDPVIMSSLAHVLIGARDYSKAEELYHNALLLHPTNFQLRVNLGTAFLLNGKDEQSLEALLAAQQQAPHSADVHTGLASYYQMHNAYEKAEFHYLEALKLAPKNVRALAGYSRLLAGQQKTTEALGFINRALRQEPKNPDFNLYQAIIKLAAGRYKEGWEAYEAGLNSLARQTPLIQAKPRPIWDGASNPKTKLLVIAEQGLGDCIQFIRYATLCKERVEKISLVCPEPLKRIMECCPSLDGVYSKEIDTKNYDAIISLMSLPNRFKTTLETVPAKTPYLFVPQAIQETWASKVVAPTGHHKIGIVWSGGLFPLYPRGELYAQRRNITLKQFLPLLDMEHTTFYSLQKGEASKQINELGLAERIVDLMPQVTDLIETAAIINALDLVISVDTSVVHLAGALGKPVWVLSRFDACWRWLKNRPKNPWYPTARIFGQPTSGDWETVIRNVVTALKEYEDADKV